MDAKECLEILATVADAYNSSLGTTALLERTASVVAERRGLKGCEFRILSDDETALELLASHGLSEEFLAKGSAAADPSVREALAGAPTVIADCRTDARILEPAGYAGEGLVSTLTVPLKTRGQVIGIMRLYAGEARPFAEDEVQLAEVLAAFSARAVAHGMFHRILDNVTRAIRSSLRLDAALEEVARAISQDLRAKGCTIHLRGPEEKKPKLRAAFGLSKKYLGTLLARPTKGFEEALQGTCTQVLDPRTEPAVPSNADAVEEGVCSILYVPLMIRDKPVGVLSCFTHHPYEFSDEEKYFMKAIADECGLAIQQSRMLEVVRQSYQTLTNDFQIWFESGYRQM